MPKLFGILHSKVISVGHHFEHLAVAGYSACEIFGVHSGLFYMSSLLMILALCGFAYEFVSGDAEGAVHNLETVVENVS